MGILVRMDRLDLRLAETQHGGLAAAALRLNQRVVPLKPLALQSLGILGLLGWTLAMWAVLLGVGAGFWLGLNAIEALVR